MKLWLPLACIAVHAAAAIALAQGLPTYSWRYYRPSNTGIQGDFNEAIWIDHDGDPWIGGYNIGFEEGGVAKFVQEENRWINISNVDYPVIGHPDFVGTSRVIDMVADDQGNLWLGMGRGVLKFNLASGASSLVRYGPGNSTIPGGWTQDMTRAPDGSIWFSAYSTDSGGGGLSRYQPATNTWSFHGTAHGGRLAAQPRPGGGIYLWTSPDFGSGVDRWDSTTQQWVHFPHAIGNPVALMSKDSVDDVGNMWILRLADEQGHLVLDCKRPDGSWITPALPPLHPEITYAALRAFGNFQLLLVARALDEYSHLYRFDGNSWTDLGIVPFSGFIDDLDIDPAGNAWLCGTGTGGAFRRDAETGEWRRYRVTNTSQFDFFNNDLTIDPETGDVYACANAAAGYGGMIKFDGARWTCWNEATYGLGFDWPFLTDNSDAVAYRPSRKRVAVAPAGGIYGIHEWNGAGFDQLPGRSGAYRMLEDSLGRLWQSGQDGPSPAFYNGRSWETPPGPTIGGLRLELDLKPDPTRAGSVWVKGGYQLLRTDGLQAFYRTIDDFPPLSSFSDSFLGLAVDLQGNAWVGGGTQFQSAGGVLFKVNPNTGAYQMWQHDLGWPFPAEHVAPLTATADGRIWMSYFSGDPPTSVGVLWWDGATIGTFPAPTGGEPQWGGLPHAAIYDVEVREIPDGYELWMSCASRGIAVLKVQYPPTVPGDMNCDGFVTVGDIGPFVLALTNPAGYAAQYPNCDINHGDINNDGSVTVGDIGGFVALLTGGE